MKKVKLQNNHCGSCGCSCTCNADCEGDVKKCTSQKAQEKQCVHCCDCFITSFMKTDNKFIQFNAKHGYKVVLAILLIGLVTELLFGFDIFNWLITALYNYVLFPLSYLGV